MTDEDAQILQWRKDVYVVPMNRGIWKLTPRFSWSVDQNGAKLIYAHFDRRRSQNMHIFYRRRSKNMCIFFHRGRSKNMSSIFSTEDVESGGMHQLT